MQQHPVPQPITSYEFRLVGDMTIKQFGKLAAGIILALVVYAINPPGFIKWPLIFIFSGIGAAMAFVPFEGRPLDVWIVAFIKRVYSPTLYLWQSKLRKQNQPTQNLPPSATLDIKTQEKPIEPLIIPQETKIEVVSQPAVKQKPVLPYIPKPPPQRPIIHGRSVAPKFMTSTTIPAAPTMANIIVGYLHTPDKRIVDGAIVEIRDGQSNPVRALKTNLLGQFQTATPLANGVYEIELEKEGFEFDIIKINLEGKPIPPIEIISK